MPCQRGFGSHALGAEILRLPQECINDRISCVLLADLLTIRLRVCRYVLPFCHRDSTPRDRQKTVSACISRNAKDAVFLQPTSFTRNTALSKMTKHWVPVASKAWPLASLSLWTTHLTPLPDVVACQHPCYILAWRKLIHSLPRVLSQACDGV